MVPASSSPDRSLLLSFAAIVLSFVAATVYAQYSEDSISQDAIDISVRVAPGIQHLTAARGTLGHFKLLTHDYLHALRGAPDMATTPVPLANELLERTLQQIQEEIRAYCALTLATGEPGPCAQIQAGLNRMDLALHRLLAEQHAHSWRTARAVLASEFSPALAQTSETIMAAIDRDARQAQDRAARIKGQRRRSQGAAYALNGLCAVLSIIAAGLALRTGRQHRRLLAAHHRLVEERAGEMERFADRVAHDIRGPLTAVGLALERLRRASLEPELRTAVERGRASLQRGERIVDGLLEFARAGAPPQRGDGCLVPVVLEDVLSELRPVAEEAGVTLRAADGTRCAAACAPGILTSLVSNLVRNAIKYMGESAVRQVSVRVLAQDAVVRIEVEDTGPGIPAGLAERVFEPYVRGGRATAAGIGLGLATVRRLAEGHGGRAGVRSQPGRGSLFWFELPRAWALESPGEGARTVAEG